jgi:hypothetical protein
MLRLLIGFVVFILLLATAFTIIALSENSKFSTAAVAKPTDPTGVLSRRTGLVTVVPELCVYGSVVHTDVQFIPELHSTDIYGTTTEGGGVFIGSSNVNATSLMNGVLSTNLFMPISETQDAIADPDAEAGWYSGSKDAIRVVGNQLLGVFVPVSERGGSSMYVGDTAHIFTRHINATGGNTEQWTELEHRVNLFSENESIDNRWCKVAYVMADPMDVESPITMFGFGVDENVRNRRKIYCGTSYKSVLDRKRWTNNDLPGTSYSLHTMIAHSIKGTDTGLWYPLVVGNTVRYGNYHQILYAICNTTLGTDEDAMSVNFLGESTQSSDPLLYTDIGFTVKINPTTVRSIVTKLNDTNVGAPMIQWRDGIVNTSTTPVTMSWGANTNVLLDVSSLPGDTWLTPASIVQGDNMGDMYALYCSVQNTGAVENHVTMFIARHSVVDGSINGTTLAVGKILGTSWYNVKSLSMRVQPGKGLLLSNTTSNAAICYSFDLTSIVATIQPTLSTTPHPVPSSSYVDDDACVTIDKYNVVQFTPEKTRWTTTSSS